MGLIVPPLQNVLLSKFLEAELCEVGRKTKHPRIVKLTNVSIKIKLGIYLLHTIRGIAVYSLTCFLSFFV